MHVTNSSLWQSISWAYSPCPNDTFTFEALALNRLPGIPPIQTPQLCDIEKLNGLAARGAIDVIKVSVAAYPEFANRYQILPAGGALGYGVGPLLVARKGANKAELDGCSVAIPGVHTTANALLNIFYPNLGKKKAMHFAEIENAVQLGKCDCGVLIHEGRFTYERHGLIQLDDLGERWTKKYQLPIPLGVICVRRQLPQIMKRTIGRAIRDSLRHAHANPEEGRPYIRKHAQELSETVLQKHIELYVNDFSYDLGPEGREAIRQILATLPKGFSAIPNMAAMPIFV